MLMDLLQSSPGQTNQLFGSVDRLITGNYKSNGNLVSLKVDIIDFTDFQRNGCLVSPGTGGLSAPHSHDITGTLFCQPDTNTVRLNITVVGPCNHNKSWSLDSGAPKDVKPWVMTSNKMTSGSADSLTSRLQYSPFTSPVSPPSQEAPPPLLDFHSDQLMSEIHSMSFDYGCGVSLNSQLLVESGQTSCVLTSPSLTHSQHSALEPDNKLLLHSQSGVVLVKPFSLLSPAPAKSITTNEMGGGHPTLLQPKVERSDSLCSEYSNRDDFLSYSEDLGNLDELDNDSSTYSPTTLSSPLIFTSNTIQSSPTSVLQDKNSFFAKSFVTKPLDKLTGSLQVVTTSALQQSWPLLTPTTSTTSSNSIHTFGPSSLAVRSPKMTSGSSPSSSETTGSPLDSHFVLSTSPKARNRRNSSFDETKPHVCPQCGARFTTKSNLGQHRKIHLAVKPFICEICSHGFTRAAHYESHVAKHKGLKTHRCEQCGESFARLDNLLRHSARHKHGKIFDCTICGKGFHRKDKLLEHEKVHSEYKFPCGRCSKTFHTNDALKHHLPLHEDTTKTQCNICLKFITIKSLSKHMSAFHKESVSTSENNNNINKSKSRRGGEEKNSPCQYCKKSFVSPAKLRLHVAKCHAAERRNENLARQSEEKTRFDTTRHYFDEIQLREQRYASPPTGGDNMASQQVPELDLPYMNSSPEDLNELSSSKEHHEITASFQIPTIHIPEFESRTRDLCPNEISTEALQALLFN